MVSGPSRIGTCAFLGRLTNTGALDPGFGTGPGEEAAACGISPPAPTSHVFQVSVRGPDGGESEYSGLLVLPDRRIVAVGTMGGDEAGEGDEPVVGALPRRLRRRPPGRRPPTTIGPLARCSWLCSFSRSANEDPASG